MLYSPSKSLQFWRIKYERLEVVRTPPPSKLKKFKQGHLTYSPFLYSTPLYSPSIQTSYKTYQLGTLTQMEPIPLVRVR